MTTFGTPFCPTMTARPSCRLGLLPPPSCGHTSVTSGDGEMDKGCKGAEGDEVLSRDIVLIRTRCLSLWLTLSLAIPCPFPLPLPPSPSRKHAPWSRVETVFALRSSSSLWLHHNWTTYTHTLVLMLFAKSISLSSSPSLVPSLSSQSSDSPLRARPPSLLRPPLRSIHLPTCPFIIIITGSHPFGFHVSPTAASSSTSNDTTKTRSTTTTTTTKTRTNIDRHRKQSPIHPAEDLQQRIPSAPIVPRCTRRHHLKDHRFLASERAKGSSRKEIHPTKYGRLQGQGPPRYNPCHIQEHPTVQAKRRFTTAATTAAAAAARSLVHVRRIRSRPSFPDPAHPAYRRR